MIRKNPAVAIVCLVFGVLGTVFTGIGTAFLLNLSRMNGMPLFFPLIFGGLGLAFLLTALVLLIGALGAERKRRAVRDRGNLVTARVTDVRLDRNVSVNGRHPYVVECRYEGDGQAYLLSSERIWTGRPDIAPGAEIPVYWDDYDPKHYTVDLAGLTSVPVTDLR